MTTILMSSAIIPMKPQITLIPLSIMTLMSLTSLSHPSYSSSFMMNDTLSNSMVSLTLMITTLILLSSQSPNQIHALITTINISLIISFSTSNILLFYIFFELSMIPTFFLITLSGKQPERLQASVYLLMYTIFASLPLLLGIIMMLPHSSFNSIHNLSLQINMPLIYTLAFLAKSPMFLLHLWLPKAHVEAPLEGSMILAAVLLKLGGYGLMRLNPMMLKFTTTMSPWIMSISTLGAILTSIMCFRQKDLKAIIAYSSVAHMALALSGIFSNNHLGQISALIIMISHGLTSSALFLLVNINYSQFHSRTMTSFKGSLSYAPNLTLWWFLFISANIGTPPFINILGEILVYSSMTQWSLLTLPLLFTSSMFMTSFCIMVFSSISHNHPTPFSPLPHTKTANHLSLLSHMAPLILLLLKPETLLILPKSSTQRWPVAS